MASLADIQREMEAAWNRRDFDKIRNMTHHEFTYTGPDGKEVAGPDTPRAIAQMYIAAFPDLAMQIKRIFTEGDTAVAETVVTGTHQGELLGIAPTGKRVEFRVCTIMEFRDGKVYRMREYFDMMTTMVQLGVMKIPGAAVASA